MTATVQHLTLLPGNVLADYGAVAPEWARGRTTLLGYAGSLAHGTHIPPEHENGTDDVDLFAVIVQPARWYWSVSAYHQHRQHFDTNGQGLDVVGFDVRKFLAMAAKGNPNVHTWLWSPATGDRRDAWVGRGGQILLANRERLLSQAMFGAILGYATGQFRKMRSGSTHGYMGAKRKELLLRYGYDIKDASHCLRLLHMGRLLGETGNLYVRLPDPELNEVLEVKRGGWTLGRLEVRVEDLFGAFQAARRHSHLPEAVDAEALDMICRLVICADDEPPRGPAFN